MKIKIYDHYFNFNNIFKISPSARYSGEPDVWFPAVEIQPSHGSVINLIGKEKMSEADAIEKSKQIIADALDQLK